MKLKTWIALAVFITSPAFMLIGMEATHDPKIFAACADIANLDNAVSQFAQRHHHLPTEAEGLAILAIGGDSEIEKIPSDPWAHPYVYRLTAGSPGFLVRSIGRDGHDDLGAGDDVTTPEKSYRCMDYDDDCVRESRWWWSHLPYIAFLASFAWLATSFGRWLSARVRRARIRRA